MIRKVRGLILAGLLAGAGLAACSPAATPDESVGAQANAGLSPVAGLALTCSGCHSSMGGGIADISDYTSEAIMTALDRYRLEVDGTTVRHRLTRGYSEDQLQAISDYLGAGQDE